MGKFCPIVQKKVTYLFCQECDDHVCEKHRVTILPKKKEKVESDVNDKKTTPESNQTPERGTCAACETCFHKMNQQVEKLFGKEMLITHCEVYRNYLIDSTKVSREGCEYHNKDMSKEKICMNCEHYLGGGDWGLACAVGYHKLPIPTSNACEQFKKKQQ